MDRIMKKKTKKRSSKSPPTKSKKSESKKNSSKSKEPKAPQRSYSSSPSPLPSPEKNKSRKSTSVKESSGLESKVEERVFKFKAEETLMVEELNKEKDRFYQNPSTHPRYQV